MAKTETDLWIESIMRNVERIENRADKNRIEFDSFNKRRYIEAYNDTRESLEACVC